MSRGIIQQPVTTHEAQIRVFIVAPDEGLLAEYREFVLVDFELVTTVSGGSALAV